MWKVVDVLNALYGSEYKKQNFKKFKSLQNNVGWLCFGGNKGNKRTDELEHFLIENITIKGNLRFIPNLESEFQILCKKKNLK